MISISRLSLHLTLHSLPHTFADKSKQQTYRHPSAQHRTISNMIPNDYNILTTLLCMLSLFTMSDYAHAYDIVIHNPAPDTYFSLLTNGSPNQTVIGEMYQGGVFDKNGKRIGIHQGYNFNLEPANWTGATQLNGNGYLYLEGGVLDMIDNDIVSATGIYEKYAGGTSIWNIVSREPFFCEITLIEPAPIGQEDEGTGGGGDEMSFRVTGKKNLFQETIYDNTTGEEIGKVFQTLVMNDINGTQKRLGTIQGYCFLFPTGAYLVPENSGDKLCVRRMSMEDGGMMLLFNRVLVQATGKYEKFIGGRFDKGISSANPYNVSEITLAMPTKEDGGDQGEEGLHGDDTGYHFFATSEEGFNQIITNQTGGQIGERFQNPVFDETQKHIGTARGYLLNFPPNVYINATTAAAATNGNRIFYLEGGNLNVLNQIIISATGKYQKYSGGSLVENIISYYPFKAEFSLVAPSSSDDSVADQTDSPVSSPANSSFEQSTTASNALVTNPYVLYVTFVAVCMGLLGAH